WQPGEAGAATRLSAFLDGPLADYDRGRDRPALEATSRLSPHLHWGEIGPRQVWHAVRHAQDARGGKLEQSARRYLSELGWREFSYNLLHHFADLPEVNANRTFDAFPWRRDKRALRAWQRGETGYPIVDAGLRELWATGWMHNRVRMIAASFLVKHLLIDWREGAAWFWDTLVDADLANNSASWQWVAGSGFDAAPYFRIFNPVLQGRKFDADGDYVRTWVPELAELPARHIHAPWEAPADILRDAGVRLGKTYPEPIVDHGAARARALEAFKTSKG
ncbi:MAG TPA: FAD-binding domain-containing protein, partial [Kiloniellales bacterium]|nr:FAD-binding domain-containing protein [Kiloniellales bacterium]